MTKKIWTQSEELLFSKRFFHSKEERKYKQEKNCVRTTLKIESFNTKQARVMLIRNNINPVPLPDESITPLVYEVPHEVINKS